MSNNRAARRREMRRVSRGENIVAIPTGERVRVDDVTMMKLPPKHPGRHRFITTACYYTPNPGAPGPKLMDQNNLVYVVVGCWDCEEPWSPELEAAPCPAEATDE